MQAVILAAGMGNRISSSIGGIPKGFIQVNGNALISMSIEKLFQSGMDEILIGTGYHAEKYERLAEEHPQIKCIHNPLYATLGSMQTLYTMRHAIRGDFLLLESDILFEQSGLEALLDAAEPNLILGSGKTNSGDEVYIETTEENRLVNMSKRPEELHSIYCELVGITKMSAAFFAEMVSQFEQCERKSADYESMLVAAGKVMPISVLKQERYAWCEIDNMDHYYRAVNAVYPKIQARETCITEYDTKTG